MHTSALALVEMLAATGAVLRGITDGLSNEQMTTVPPWHRNHILWNVGHVVVSQQILTYKLSGLPMYVSDELVAHFARGTSPLDWTSAPDPAEVFALLDELPRRLREDVAAGRFERFTPYQTTTGPYLATLGDALAFTLFHEGLHAGVVLSQRKLVG